MALGDPYATLSDLKARLGITDATEDARLDEALTVASRGIEHCTHRQFNAAAAAAPRLYYPDGSGWATVDDFYTTDDLTIETDAGGGAWTTWAADDYELHPLNGIVDGATGWPYWRIKAIRRPLSCADRASLRVTAKWGWAAVPAPIKEATLILAEEIFKLRDTPFGAGGYGEYGRIRARENPNVWLRIAPYQREAVLVA